VVKYRLNVGMNTLAPLVWKWRGVAGPEKNNQLVDHWNSDAHCKAILLTFWFGKNFGVQMRKNAGKTLEAKILKQIRNFVYVVLQWLELPHTGRT